MDNIRSQRPVGNVSDLEEMSPTQINDFRLMVSRNRRECSHPQSAPSLPSSGKWTSLKAAMSMLSRERSQAMRAMRAVNLVEHDPDTVQATFKSCLFFFSFSFTFVRPH